MREACAKIRKSTRGLTDRESMSFSLAGGTGNGPLDGMTLDGESERIKEDLRKFMVRDSFLYGFINMEGSLSNRAFFRTAYGKGRER